MSRLQQKMAELKASGRKALIPFITAGDPNPAFTVPAMHAMVAAGADILELGVPFSDPMADGPVIQKASERALAHHMSLRKTLNLVADFRLENTTTPVVLMGYLNPVECMGYDVFAQRAAAVGVDGVLTVDMPPEEADKLVDALKHNQIDPIFLLAPNSSPARIRKMSELGQGYLYYVSLKGVTGASHLDLDQVAQKLTEIRLNTCLPVAVGFGVKDAVTAARIAGIADGVVVGSALVSSIAEHADAPEKAIQHIVQTLSDMRAAIDV